MEGYYSSYAGEDNTTSDSSVDDQENYLTLGKWSDSQWLTTGAA